MRMLLVLLVAINALVVGTGLLLSGCKKKQMYDHDAAWSGISRDRACTWTDHRGICLSEGKEYTCVSDDSVDRVVCIEASPCNK